MPVATRDLLSPFGATSLEQGLGIGVVMRLSARDPIDVAEIDGATVRLHWTDAPYVWHVNDGPEVFAVLDGAVDTHHRRAGACTSSG